MASSRVACGIGWWPDTTETRYAGRRIPVEMVVGGRFSRRVADLAEEAVLWRLLV